MNYWLVKSEPFKYGWDQFVRDKRTFWDGVRNYGARNNMRDMKLGDLVLFYHSNEGLEIVGVAEVVKEAYQDPTTTETAWVVVELKPKKRLKRAVTLKELKSDSMFENMELIRLQRLSVSKVTTKEFERVLNLSGTTLG